MERLKCNQFSHTKINHSRPISIVLVSVPHNFGSGPTFLAALGSVNLVPSSSVYFITVRSDGWTVPKNANHSKTCKDFIA
jgi:hypothetical protein